MIVDLMRVPSDRVGWVRGVAAWHPDTAGLLRNEEPGALERLGVFHDAVDEWLRMDPKARAEEVYQVGLGIHRGENGCRLAVTVGVYGPGASADLDIPAYEPPTTPPDLPDWLERLAARKGMRAAKTELSWYVAEEPWVSRWLVKFVAQGE